MRTTITLLALLAILVVATATQTATVPTRVAYQGYLTNSGGTPLSGTYTLTLRLFSAISGGTALWSETQPIVATNGLFSIDLGSVNPLEPTTLFDPNNTLENGNRFLEIHVAGQLSPLTPRTRLVCSPYALVAASVANSNASLSHNQLNLSDSVEGTKTELTSSDLSFSRNATIGALARNPMTFDWGGKMSLCSLSFADTTGETLAVLDGALGGLTLGSRSEAAVRLYNNASTPNLKLAELTASGSGGPALKFFDEAGEVMGLGPSPFNGGFSIKLFSPLVAPPKQLLELRADYDDGHATNLTMSGSAGSSTIPLASMSARSGSGTLRIGRSSDPANSGTLIQAMAGETESRLDISGAPVTWPLVQQNISLFANTLTARVGIGTASPSQALHVVGNICYTGTIGACSDARFKKDMEPIRHALESVDQLTGMRYSWRTEAFPDKRFSTDRQVGVTAQDVKHVLPEAVMEESDGYYSVDYSRLTPLLIEAIKELKKQNEDLSRRLNAVEKSLH